MNRFWWGLLVLTLRTFRCSQGARTEQCPTPPEVEFAVYLAEAYKVGTKVKYECNEGHTRVSGQLPYIRCRSEQDGFAQWTTGVCIVSPAKALPLSEQPLPRAEEASSPAYDIPSTTAKPPMKDFCGIPKPPKHAKTVSTTYRAGQELQYWCLDRFQARDPISGKSTCQYSGRSLNWSSPGLRCTNDTTSEIPDFTGVTEIPGPTPRDSAVVIYSATAVFAIAMMAAVVIL